MGVSYLCGKRGPWLLKREREGGIKVWLFQNIERDKKVVTWKLTVLPSLIV